MANNLYTATETLKTSFMHIVGESDLNLSSKGIVDEEFDTVLGNEIVFHAAMWGFEVPTVSELLLAYYQSEEGVFSKKNSGKKLLEDKAKKASIINSYFKSQVAKIRAEGREPEVNKEFLKSFTDNMKRMWDAYDELEDNSHNQNSLEPNDDESRKE